jgi:hypothetical protein
MEYHSPKFEKIKKLCAHTHTQTILNANRPLHSKYYVRCTNFNTKCSNYFEVIRVGYDVFFVSGQLHY